MMKRLCVFLAVLSVLNAQMYYPNPTMNAMPMTMPQQGYPQSMAYLPAPPVPAPTNPVPSPAPEKVETPKVQCEHGACCSATKTFLPSGEPCRATTNPCEEIARCNGNSAECPENPKKTNGADCMVTGKCTDGYCTEYTCVGLCCANGLPASDGTPCGPDNEGGKCVTGTCTVYRKVDPHVTPLSEEEKEIITEARKEVKGEIEALLRSHARYIKRKVQFEENTKKNTAERIESTVGITNVTGAVSNLASGDEEQSSLFSWSGITIIIGLAFLAFAVFLIFFAKPKERAEAKAQHVPKKRAKEDMSSADYDPPAF